VWNKHTVTPLPRGSAPGCPFHFQAVEFRTSQALPFELAGHKHNHFHTGRIGALVLRLCHCVRRRGYDGIYPSFISESVDLWHLVLTHRIRKDKDFANDTLGVFVHCSVISFPCPLCKQESRYRTGNLDPTTPSRCSQFSRARNHMLKSITSRAWIIREVL